MPLEQSGSKKALQKNIATEINAGKKPDQAAAIAYSVQRQNDSVPEYAMSANTGLPLSVSASQIAAENNARRGK